MTDSSYFKKMVKLHAAKPALPVRARPCNECPVINGMYEEISEDLTHEPYDVRLHVSERWFCHTNPDRCCRGNWEIQKLGKRKT
jgi:hypothetical protein